jgi:TonB family protein
MRLLFILPLFAVLGNAETIHVSLPVTADTNGVWHVSKAFADVPRGAVSPKLISAPQSSVAKIPVVAAALVSVSFQIDERGTPFNIQIDKSSDKDLDDEVIAMIREWRFEAALSGGVAIQSRVSIDLSTGQLPPDDQPRPVRRK